MLGSAPLTDCCRSMHPTVGDRVMTLFRGPYSMVMEARGIYRERNGWGTNIVSASNTTSTKNSTCHKIATALVATSRPLINCRGKTRAEAA